MVKYWGASLQVQSTELLHCSQAHTQIQHLCHLDSLFQVNPDAFFASRLFLSMPLLEMNQNV